MQIKLSNAEVKIKDQLTWGDTELIQQAVMTGAKIQGDKKGDMDFAYDPKAMLEAKFVALECAVLSIKEGEKEFEFTREWMNGLSVEDGDKLYEAVDSLSKK